MRLMLLSAVAVVSLAACQKDPPAPEPNSSAAIESEATGQDDPSVPFTPAAVQPPSKYEPVSKTAMSLTGPLTLTPTTQTGPNMPPGAIFSFGMGFSYTTTLQPGAALQGTPQYDWSTIMPKVNPASIQFYTVDSQDPKPAPGTAGLCDNIFGIAIATTTDSVGETLHLAAFTGSQWPPVNADTALCGTYSYMPAEPAPSK